METSTYFLLPTHPQVSHMNAAIQYLRAVRERMAASGIGALVVLSADTHNSEYVAKQFMARGYLTNFHGSAGTAVVTPDEALLWTDGRYWLEASLCIPACWTLMKEGCEGVPTVQEWVGEKGIQSVGLDSYTSTMSYWEKLSKVVPLCHSGIALSTLKEVAGNLEGGATPIYIRPAQYCGQSIDEKVAAVHEEMKSKGMDAVLLSALDEIAWLLNLRGADIEHNPVFISYACVTVSSVTVFVDPAKVTDAVRDALPNVSLRPYTTLSDYITDHLKGKRVGVSENQTSQGIYVELTTAGASPIPKGDIVQHLKSIKNPVELQGFRDAHVRDGVALTRFLAWLHNEVSVLGNTSISEVDAADRLLEFRKLSDMFIHPSFTTISSTGANGAVIHYSPVRGSDRTLRRGELYLVDSGGQYWDGTTDVTRVLCFSPPTAKEREAYTLVLKGHIGINSLVWPPGITGHRLDAFARQALWASGLDYAHGTGHGVGSFLNVHEGPHGIHSRPPSTQVPLKAGMTTSNEPGYYENGKFGIRIENVEIIIPKATKYGNGFLGLEYVTMTPLCPDLIDPSLLTDTEIEWVNTYHSKVRDALAPGISQSGDALAASYLTQWTAPIQK